MMNREDKYSLQALDFTKTKVKEKVNEDVFPVALDLSMHHSEPSCSTYMDGNQPPVHSSVQNCLGREQRFWENGVTVAEDLRVPVIPCTSAKRIECGQNPMRWLKGSKTSVHGRKQDELKVNQLIGKKMKDYNKELLSTKLFNNTVNVDEGFSFNFPKTVRPEGFVGNTSFGLSSASQVKDLPLARQADCNSREILERCISASDANTQNRQTVLRYGSEASLSEIARSSFGQLCEEPCDLQGRQQYDDYAKQFADFLKSTASNKRNEQDLLSSSEESQADDVYEVNILEEESNQPDAYSSLLVENETSVCLEENESLQQKCETRLDKEEEFNEESLVESKTEITMVSEPNDAENSMPADAGGKKRKRKAKDVDNSELQASKPKRKKTTQPQASEAKTNVLCLAAANVFEYQWPQEKNADWFVLQEHISEFLGILSFKRKYPDIFRRSVDISERNFLRERGVVTEMQCDLGLTALKTEDVCDLMSKDYPEKYQEYTKLLSSRQKIAEPAKVHENTVTEKSKMETLLKKSIKATADYNASLMRERYHERRAYFDLQTFEVHYPNSTKKSNLKVPLKTGAYPVSLIPGQYQDYYKRYTQQELNYFPLNTALYSPHKMLKSIFTDPTCVAVDDTEDDDGPDEGRDHISISSSLDQTLDDVESVIPEDKREDKRIGPESIDPDKQKSPITLSLDAEDSITMLEDSAENSRSSFKDVKIGKTPLSSRRMPRLSGKKKLEDVLSIDIDNALNDAFSRPGRELIPKCVVCSQAEKSYNGLVEDVVQCSECASAGHPSCLDLTKEMVEVIKTYPWQCMECKTCIKCMEPHDEEKMMFCDHCDRGYHTFCVGLKSIPEGRWECPSCLDNATPPKPKRGRPLKYPRPHVTPKADAT